MRKPGSVYQYTTLNTPDLIWIEGMKKKGRRGGRKKERRKEGREGGKEEGREKNKGKASQLFSYISHR